MFEGLRRLTSLLGRICLSLAHRQHQHPEAVQSAEAQQHCRTPECPTLPRLCLIAGLPESATLVEKEHIESGCRYCDRTIASAKRQGAGEYWESLDRAADDSVQ